MTITRPTEIALPSTTNVNPETAFRFYLVALI